MKARKIKLLHVTTVPQTLFYFLRGQIQHVQRKGILVEAISSPGPMLEELAQREQIKVYPVLMVRGISLFRDLASVWKLWWLFRKLSPTIVHGSTPKAGLLTMIAGALARVPIRFYTIRGLHITSRTGVLRRILRLTEKISCFFAHQVICVSHSIRNIAVAEGICPESKIKVLHHGSSNGVDAQRFCRSNLSEARSQEFRRQWNIPEEAQVLGFIGRLVRDKGIHELISAWNLLRPEFPKLHLLLVGSLEDHDPLDRGVVQQIREDPRIHHTGMIKDVLPVYGICQVAVLPSYREGFPNVPLEAAAMELPVIATRVPGCMDAVVEGVAGILVPPREVPALAQAIRALLRDPELRKRMGQAGRERILRDFRPENIWQALYQEYLDSLEKKGIPAPQPESA
ncbi:MAG: hypothetical protein A2V67_02900 [Deltaproteobacteria bacterium RBG_13_61_14]|nr:MAG: hypothetical protein A2V67_02900 [Deltaproteobacteria bacterium RBG_13_61_14]